MSADGAEALRLRIGRTTVAAGAMAEVARAISTENERRRIRGLEDVFAVGLIDPVKATALISALEASPGTVAALGGRALILDGVAQGISFASPTRVSAFKAPLAIAVSSEHSDGVIARAEVAVDCTLARERAAAARNRTEAADRAAAGQDGPAGGRARELLHAAARAWSLNAAAAAGCAPGDAAAAADAKAAEAKARATTVPSGSMG